MKLCKEKTEYSKAFISAVVDQDLDFIREILPFADVNFKVTAKSHKNSVFEKFKLTNI